MSFWRKEFTQDQVSLILDKIKEIRNYNTNGRISFNGGYYDYWTSILISAVGMEVKSDTLRSRIVRGSISSPELPEDFTERDFRRIANQLRHKYQSVDLHIHRVAFPIWNKPTFLTGTRKLDDVTLNFTPSPESPVLKKIIKERHEHCNKLTFKSFFSEERLRDLNNCSLCLASIRANSPGDANERASNALYEVLGLLNLAADGGKISRTSFRVAGKLPVSSVLIGPFTTTHFSNGKLTHDGFWHENWVGGPNQNNRSPEAMQGWEKRFKNLTVAVKKSAWKDKAKISAARYFKAFSNPNLEESFLEGWRLFENISGTRHEKISDQLLRTSNLFESKEEYHVIGQHLALRRNLLAHGHAIKTDDEETLAFQMHRFVVPFLTQYLKNDFKFHSPSMFWEFLDLPTQRHERVAKRSEHERQIDLLIKAAKFRGEVN